MRQRNRRDMLKMTAGFAAASISDFGLGPARGGSEMAGGALLFFADEHDVPILLNRLNADPDIAFIIPDGPLTPEQVVQNAVMQMLQKLPPGVRGITYTCINSDYRQHWRAVRLPSGLNDGQHSLWHVPTGPLPLLKADGTLEPIPDPWVGWTEERPACQPHTPYFGSAYPAEIRLQLWTRRDRNRRDDRLMVSDFQWTGGPPRTGHWWDELEGWFSRTATGLHDASGSEVVWAFPSALRELKEGSPYHANGLGLDESIRRAVAP